MSKPPPMTAPGSKFGIAWQGDSNPSSDPDFAAHLSESADTELTPTNFHETRKRTDVQDPDSHMAPTPPAPRLSRAFSTPLPSQIAHFEHPARRPGLGSSKNSIAAEGPVSEVQQFQEFSLELADSLQTAIQTLLQLSPPHLFDAAKEQFSSCSVQVPTTSMSALLTSVKTLNYMSANMHKFGSPVRDDDLPSGSSDTHPKDNFDIGELLQSVGDSLSGVAAQAEVDLVLYHGDAGIKHVGVKGDECGLSYALSHIIHQVLITTRPGDSLEIGLSVYPKSHLFPDHSTPDDEGLLVCTFDIAHRFFSSTVDGASPNDSSEEPAPEQKTQLEPSSDVETRPVPNFNTIVLRRLLRYIGGTLRPYLRPQLFRTGKRCELSVTLERGLPFSHSHQNDHHIEEQVTRQLPNVPLAQEPALDELISFAETLRGKRVVFHASSQGSFAHHLTRYLISWGMDISHLPTDDAEDRQSAEDEQIVIAEPVFSGSSSSSPGLGIGLPIAEIVPSIADSASDTPEDNNPPVNESVLFFIIIDDDVIALRRRLLQYRLESPNLHLQPRKQRPSLATNHRPRSSPSIRSPFLTVSAHHQPLPPPAFTPVPIIHFTSLANYKIVKDALQTILISSPILPEVIVIPKPAGPRRLLTALYTAVNKPVIDPFFLPIATSPMSHGSSISPYTIGRKSGSSTTPPLVQVRGESARAARSPRESNPESVVGSAGSPLSMPEGLEYFPDASVKKLGGNAASGLVIQSPDGRPAGIFFQPQLRTSSSRSEISSLAMERERGAAGTPGSQRSGRRNASQRVRSSSRPDATEANTSVTQAPLSNVAGAPPIDRPSSLSSQHDGPKVSEQPEFLKQYKGKEVTQAPVKQALALSTATDTNFDPAAATRLSPSLGSDATSISARKASQASIPSPSSPVSTENRKFPPRRVVTSSKSSLSSPLKKPRSFGNNIVPPISVLIVEDNAINQTILSTFMRRNKIKYEVAWNGREAVEKWRNGNFHLILMDIQMPVMDGIEATKEIRRLEKLESLGILQSQNPAESSRRSTATPDSGQSSASPTPPGCQVIIVALTASSLQSDRVAALAAGCNDFLTKPVTNSWLNDKVIEWGSIKALQMWAELRPEVKHVQEGQASAAVNKLHAPPTSTSTRRSPLSSVHTPAAIEAAPQDGTDHATRFGKPPRRSSDKSSTSDSSVERWHASSDEEGPLQDPITEPPAVIETPERGTIALPEVDSEPHPFSGEVALPSYLEEAKQQETTRPALLGQRAKSALNTSVSIASVMHDTPGAGEAATDGLTAADAATQDGTSDLSSSENGPPRDH